MKNFWESRLEAHGHTGYSDQSTYCFDQQCRLGVFERWLDAAGMRPDKALDFGCGIGDFSRVLLRRGWRVVAYDPFVTPKISDPHLTITRDREQIATHGPFNLIVSITVLDCILDDGTFADELRLVHKHLSPNGAFFFLEYSISDDRAPLNDYQAFRSTAQWRAALDGAGLSLDSAEPYFHPTFAPIDAWKAYGRNLIVRGVARTERIIGRIGVLDLLRKSVASRCLQHSPYKPPDKSPLNLLCGRNYRNERTTVGQ